METVDFVNASDFFNAIELGDAEKGEYLYQFFHGDVNTAFTLIRRALFLQSLIGFIADCEDIYEKDVMMEKLRDYNLSVNDHVRYINIQAQMGGRKPSLFY